jgi:ribosome-associated toxin RatA of RatAB toxin-antitoxin module
VSINLNIPKDLKKKVNEIIVDAPDELFVWLNKGWAFEPHEDESKASHCMGLFRNITEIREQVKYASKCSCDWCKGLIN